MPTARIVNVDQVRRKSLCVQQSFSPESSPVSPVARASLLFQQSSQNVMSQSVHGDRFCSKNEVDDKDKDVDYRSEDPHSDEQSAISTPSTPLSCDDMEPLLSPFLGKGGGEVQPCYPTSNDTPYNTRFDPLLFRLITHPLMPLISYLSLNL